ncbi:MAG: GNAT family N-acetyltransferase [Rhodocyclaceae bacterium]|nr:GNAT family N-acetyltransferase [Rhodocyclaceae bacterium]MDZ4215693.1 GNAT family N-acetyltransferase [Rhodocyclaceae bacterium]
MLSIRNLRSADIPSVIALQQRVYTTIPAFQEPQFESLLREFPTGQVVAELDGEIVGIALSLVILWDDYSLHHTWASVTNDGLFDTHDMGGRTLYGAEVCVDPKTRGQGVGHTLYDARRTLCKAMNLKRIIAGGRLPDYHKVATQMAPEEYAKRVIWGDLYDPVLRFQLDEGFDYCGILHGYLPNDIDSVGNASLIVWLNRDYDSERPTQAPPAGLFEEKS